MKFQIDTIAKEIHVLENCKLGELISTIEQFLPEWKEYTLVNKTPHEFSNPIIIKVKEEKVERPYWIEPFEPKRHAVEWPDYGTKFPITCNTETVNSPNNIGLLNQGVYNFEMS